MAAGAIPVGVCPTELRDLMGYNPVIEVDTTSPLTTFDYLLKNISTFSELKENNRIAVEQMADWRVRIEELRNACAT